MEVVQMQMVSEDWSKELVSEEGFPISALEEQKSQEETI